MLAGPGGVAELQHGAGPSQLAWGRAAESAGAAASVFPGLANPETSWQQTQSPSPQFSHGQSQVAPLPLTDGAPGGTSLQTQRDSEPSRQTTGSPWPSIR